MTKMKDDEDEPSGMRVEGYWDTGDGVYPMPIEHSSPWEGKAEFLKKLARLEKKTERIYYRGLSWCRICHDSAVGDSEFKDSTHGIVWTDALGPHYIKLHNVIPSKEFFNYVMTAE